MKDNSKFKIQNSKLIFFEFLEASALNSLNTPRRKSTTGVTPLLRLLCFYIVTLSYC